MTHDRNDDQALWLTFAPVIWLVIVGLCLVGSLYGVGYLHAGETKADVGELVATLKGLGLPALVPRQAALAQSGVLLAITVALSFTCMYWTTCAWRGDEKVHRRSLVLAVVVILFLIAFVALLLLSNAGKIEPFVSNIGRKLLEPKSSDIEMKLAAFTPGLMYFLSCFVPAVLVCGASFLLIPFLDSKNKERAQVHVDTLLTRFKEMDQLLYIGALTLVFGTLQLSAGMSVPLAGVPLVSEVKAELDLCKTTHADQLKSTEIRSVDPKGSFYANHSAEQCHAAMGRMQQAIAAEDLRDFVKGITFSFGLAFSALLAAVYVPGAMVLRKYLEEPSATLKVEAAKDPKAAKLAVADIDPVSRIAAIVATLSPLLAGILASVIPK